MKLFALTLASIVVSGVSALAMPQWDGTYNCTYLQDNSQATATLTTRDNKLFLEGAGAGSSGFPCTNVTTSESRSGITVQTTSTCSDTQLSNKSVLLQPATKTDLVTVITVNRMSDKQVSIAISFSGMTGGANVGTTLNLDCRR